MRTVRSDTLEHPAPLADSLFLPERTGTRQRYETLLGGLVMGGAVMLLPGTLAPEATLAGTRYAVGGAMSLAGIVGFFTRRPGMLVPENVAANAALRENWNERLGTVVAENADRIAGIRLVVEVGTARIVELRRR